MHFITVEKIYRQCITFGKVAPATATDVVHGSFFQWSPNNTDRFERGYDGRSAHTVAFKKRSVIPPSNFASIADR